MVVIEGEIVFYLWFMIFFCFDGCVWYLDEGDF